MSSRYTATQDAIATGTALKTLLELASPATTGPLLTVFEWWIEFDGVTATAVPVLVEITRGTATITGTALTPRRMSAAGLATPAATAKHTATAEGTPTDTLYKKRVPPTSGLYVQFPLGREIEVPTGEQLRVRVTAAATVNAAVGFGWEE